MPTSRSRAMPREGVKPNRGQTSLEAPPTRRMATQSGSALTHRGPEWKTERRKLQVEAEARSLLKKSIGRSVQSGGRTGRRARRFGARRTPVDSADARPS